MRTGIIAKKIGMTRVFTDEGIHVPVTLLKIDVCQVTNIKTEQKHGYLALQVGSQAVKQSKLKKPLQGYFAKLQIEPRKKLAEFRVSAEHLLSIGDQIQANHFDAGQYVDVTAKSIGKGFSGVMKRHNFSGHRASHGASIAHRTAGSTGAQDTGKVWKNKRMAGQMGHKQVTVQNLQVHQICLKDNLVIVKGAVPGSIGTHVFIKDAVKRKNKNLSTSTKSL